jgi:hypothetical protein
MQNVLQQALSVIGIPRDFFATRISMAIIENRPVQYLIYFAHVVFCKRFKSKSFSNPLGPHCIMGSDRTHEYLGDMAKRYLNFYFPYLFCLK